MANVQALTLTTDGVTNVTVSKQNDLFRTLYREMACSQITPVTLAQNLVMWVDEEATLRGGIPRNDLANVIAGLFGRTNGSLGFLGHVVFTSTPDEEGNDVGLTDDQVAELTAVVEDLNGIQA
jgi:hypothetical protein